MIVMAIALAGALTLSSVAAFPAEVQRVLDKPRPGFKGLPSSKMLEKKPLPWDRDIKRTQKRGRDLLRKLGLGPHTLPNLQRSGPAPKAGPDPFAPFMKHDTNRDGKLSIGEYFSLRSRPTAAGPDGTARRRAIDSRLRSRFRAADSNRDGQLSAQ